MINFHEKLLLQPPPPVRLKDKSIKNYGLEGFPFKTYRRVVCSGIWLVTLERYLADDCSLRPRNQFDPDIRDIVDVKIVHGSWRKEDSNRVRLEVRRCKFTTSQHH